MPDHAKEYSFDVIKIAMCANESCFDEFEFRKTLMKGANERIFALLSDF